MSVTSLLGLGLAAYFALLIGIALWVERNAHIKDWCARQPIIYALSLTIYNTTWSFYGLVGQAASEGLTFMTTHLGTTLGLCLWPFMLRKIVRIKSTHRITSIADFLSARYGRSQGVAGLVTTIALVGTLPYVAIQVKAVKQSLHHIVTALGEPDSFLVSGLDPILASVMILFTILAGARRLDPTERHHGMVAALAVESLIKLAAILVVGFTITYVFNDGFADLFTRFAETPWAPLTGLPALDTPAYSQWTTGMVLGMAGILVLPRQFHVAVVENSNERHILHAIWMFPIYMLLFNIFALPMAMSGLLEGLPPQEADMFVLTLPIAHDAPWIAGLAFFGGFSAGIGMVMVTSMTMGTMITNHLLLPLMERLPALSGFRNRLLQLRWVVICVFISLGFAFNTMVGHSYMLVSLGRVAFAAVAQFAPPLVGGLYWSRASRKGALAGLTAGFIVWCYTLLLPAFINGGWLPPSLLSTGPDGLGLLNPEHLFGLHGMTPLTHSVFWSLLLNTGCFIIFSLGTQTTREQSEGYRFINVMDDERHDFARSGSLDPHIQIGPKKRMVEELFAEYYAPLRAKQLARQCVSRAQLIGLQYVTIDQLARFYEEVEAILTGAIGAAMAHKAMRRRPLFTTKEAQELSTMYADILANMHLSPEDLIRRINYHEERENLLGQHAEELEEANARLRAAEENYRLLFENALEGIFQTTPDGHFLAANPAQAKLLGYESPKELLEEVRDIGRDIYHSPVDREHLLTALYDKGFITQFVHLIKRRDGSLIWAEIHARLVRDENGAPRRIEGTMRDITDRKRAEQEIIRAGQYVRDVLNSMPSILIAVDEDLRITHWNKAAEHERGMTDSDVLGRYLGDVYPEMDPHTPLISEALQSRAPRYLEKVPYKRGNEIRRIDLMVYPLSSQSRAEAVIRMDDVTEQSKMEEMMIQTEKMLSVGGLAAGMAHEINNPLGGILQGVQNIQRRVSPELKANQKVAEELSCPLETIQEYMKRRKILSMLDGIRESGERAAGIVMNMLEFSRRSEATMAKEDIHTLLDHTLELASTDYDLKKSYDFRSVTIQRNYAEDLPAVVCSASEIEQVFLNLFKNAAQAMTEHGSTGPPAITITTSHQHGRVRIDITDNGPGMDEGTRSRIFEPFFTTKPKGVGTGLGLSVSYFIVTSTHGGRFSVHSAPGEGTTFTIDLPVTPLDKTDDAAPA
ncbi:sodium:solute symporter family transporter [Desulfobaculum sp.]